MTPNPQATNLELAKAIDDLVEFAIARHQASDLAGAEALYGKALALSPVQPVALHNLGLLHLGSGRRDSALMLLREATVQRPGEPAFHFSLAMGLQEQGDLAGALAEYAAATRLQPAYREAWENQAVVLQDLNRLDEAIAAYQQAMKIDRFAPIACYNLPKALRAFGRPDEAIKHYQHLLDEHPFDLPARVGYGATLMSVGHLAEAWPFLEGRLMVPETLANNPTYRVPLPRWSGEPLPCKTLLVYGEQGVGDEVMFASCLPDLSQHGIESAIVLCEPRLVPLFARSFPQLRVAARQGDQPDPGAVNHWHADCCVAIGSLPLHYRPEAATFPGKAFLFADPAAVAAWRERLAALGDGPKIGLSWRGGNEPRTRRARSIPLAAMAPLFGARPAVFVNLQYGDHGAEIAAFNATSGSPLQDLGGINPLQDLDGFSALLSALDLVITVDNSTVHLAGALGVPAWLLVPSYADWRWTIGHDRTLWYDSVRLFWQDTSEAPGWQSTLGRMAAELAGHRFEASAAGRPLSGPAAAPLPALPPGQRLALLVNDTAYWYHWGCTATSLALHAGLAAEGFAIDSLPITAINRLTPLPTRIEDLDDPTFIDRFCRDNAPLLERLGRAARVVINGEGSLHGLGQTALALLTLAWVAKRVAGCDTRIVNHSAYPADSNAPAASVAEALYRKVYSVLDYIAVREPVSARELDRLGIAATLSFDCLPLFVERYPPPPRPDRRRVVLAGSVALSPARLATLATVAEACLAEGLTIEVLVGANAFPAADDALFVNAIHPRLKGRYRLVIAHSEAEWLATLADAALLVSGRFHHTIAAAFQRTPVAVASSNTRKIEGLLELLGLALEDVWLDLESPEKALACVRRLLDNPQPALASTDTLATLRTRALLNFSDQPAIDRPTSAAGA